MAFPGSAHTHNNTTQGLTFTESLNYAKHKTQKNDLNWKLQKRPIITMHM